jgi:hypothetical protein
MVRPAVSSVTVSRSHGDTPRDSLGTGVERYSQLIVQVADPDAAVKLIQSAL